MYKNNIKYVCVVMSALMLTCFSGCQGRTKDTLADNALQQDMAQRSLYAGITKTIDEVVFQSGVVPKDLRVKIMTPEQKAMGVYTFLQGPRAYEESLPWSGDWCQFYVKGRSFGGFGCGHCCMANIYSTMSPYECSLVDMYEYATQVTDYYPSRESGAIGWHDMKDTLKAAGFHCRLHRKPDTYEEFQQQMIEATSAIVLVSSAYDDTFWKDTSGHYVNIWYYQKETDMVFLAEPGDPENNRSWIPLRYVYDALKVISQYQYLSVQDYSEEQNQWKWNSIEDQWNGK